MLPLDDLTAGGDDPFAMLMLTVVVQLNRTCPCSPLLIIMPPVVCIVETESPPVPPAGPENERSMLVSNKDRR